MTEIVVPRPTADNPAPYWLRDPDWVRYTLDWGRRFAPATWPCCGHTTARREVRVGKDVIPYIDHEPDCRVGNDFDLSTLVFWFVMWGVIVGPPDGS